MKSTSRSGFNAKKTFNDRMSIRIAFAATFLLVPPASRSETAFVNGVEWEISVTGGCATIVGGEWSFYPEYWNPPTTSLAIPSVLNGYPVTGIGDGAFDSCVNLTSVSIPTGIKSIGDWAFCNCSGLASVTIPNSVKIIGDYAFGYCGSLKAIALPNSVTSIGEDAFCNCNGLTNVMIPDSVTSIGEYAFYECSGLTSVTIPNSVTNIAEGTFISCSGLVSVTIPSSVQNIGDDAFAFCDSLTSIDIPEGVKTIGSCTFRGCTSLNSISIPCSISSIDPFAFDGCTSVRKIAVPGCFEWGSLFYKSKITSAVIYGGVPNICDCAFRWCKSLQSVVIKNGVESIGNEAFTDCSNLTSVSLPKTLKTIGASFIDCSSLRSISIPKSVRIIDNHAFDGCVSLSSVEISFGVSRIGDWAFSDCKKLTSLTVPLTVTSIGNGAFYRSGLQKLYLPDRFRNKVKNDGISFLPTSCRVIYISTSYKVAYNANGGTLPKGKSMAAQKMTYGKAAALRKNAFTRSGYVFIGWAKTKTGTIAYKNAQSVKNLRTDGKAVTLYAVWAKKTYKVAFYANGGTGKMAVESFTYGKAKKLTANKFKAPKGKKFAGWATSAANAKAGKVAYKNKQAVKNLVTTGKTVKLYAVWKKK